MRERQRPGQGTPHFMQTFDSLNLTQPARVRKNGGTTARLQASFVLRNAPRPRQKLRRGRGETDP